VKVIDPEGAEWMRLTKKGNATVDVTDAQLVHEPNGDVVLYFHKIDGESLPKAWVVRVKKDGTLTPGQMKRLRGLLDAGKGGE
jgi:hypothetical protein